MINKLLTREQLFEAANRQVEVKVDASDVQYEGTIVFFEQPATKYLFFLRTGQVRGGLVKVLDDNWSEQTRKVCAMKVRLMYPALESLEGIF